MVAVATGDADACRRAANGAAAAHADGPMAAQCKELADAAATAETALQAAVDAGKADKYPPITRGKPTGGRERGT